MKYGEHLKANIASEYGPDPYLNYERLDEIISQLSETKPSGAIETSRVVSMTAPPQTNAQGLDTSKFTITNEDFLKVLDGEMVKVERFTLTKVTELRDKIKSAEAAVKKYTNTPSPRQRKKSEDNSAAAAAAAADQQQQQQLQWDAATIEGAADEIANDFLRLEKYVNINFMGFHKILKKHDKNLPLHPCKAFYVNRLHAQAWVRGDYSDIVVRLSNLYSAIRDDAVAAEKQDASQSFLRSTTKYWVKTEDVSRVKYAVLRHLPVFLQKTSTGESDSQFTNSVYLDNDALELYHGRLDKTPGAIALRLRWYGPGDPNVVFVERKTHNEKWTGEVSVKERFMIDESEVKQVMTNTYPIEAKKQAMLASGKSAKEADEWETLVREITQVVASKQLVPTMRTQCMRTAFQIPFDATVRVSLDTNLCMISERGYDLQDMSVWHRDKSWVLEKNEIHRFPHAVLEIKLEMGGANMTPPQWVLDLQNSGMLYECHKYSKYVHGCAVLLPEDVQAVPYWVDDVSLRQSIYDCEGQRILAETAVGVGPGANKAYGHLLPFGTTVDNRELSAIGRTHVSQAVATGQQAAAAKDQPDIRRPQQNQDQDQNQQPPPVNSIHFGATNAMEMPAFAEQQQRDDDDDGGDHICGGGGGWMFPFCSRNNQVYEMQLLAPTSVQKIEPKVFFANERTFLHWLHYGVLLSSVAAGILSFSRRAVDYSRTAAVSSEIYALVLLPISLGFCVYALRVYLWRAERIKSRIPGRWDDPSGPLWLGSAVAAVLILDFIFKIFAIVSYDGNRNGAGGGGGGAVMDDNHANDGFHHSIHTETVVPPPSPSLSVNDTAA